MSASIAEPTLRRIGTRMSSTKLSQYGTPVVFDRLDESGTARALRRVRLTSGTNGAAYDEGWVQGLIHRFPQALPLAEIEPRFESVMPVCVELSTAVGNADNLFVTAAGDLVLVECKLWRNPEARRKVIAQVIDYAHCLSRWSYQDLEEAVSKARGSKIALFDIVTGKLGGDEAAFVDAVSRNLRYGRILLLIVGDGIREEMGTLTDYLQGHAGIHFTVGLVELMVYELPGSGQHVVLPRVLAKTVLVERGIVRIDTPDIRVGPPDLAHGRQGAPRSRRTTISEEEFFETLSSRLGRDRCNGLRAFLEEMSETGVAVKFGKSMILKWTAPNGREFNLGCIFPNGDLRTEPVNWEADAIGEIGLTTSYLRELASIVGGRVVETPKRTGWYVAKEGKTLPSVTLLLDRAVDWRAAIERYVGSLQEALRRRL